MPSIKWTRGQTELLSALRITNHPEIGNFLERASVDDLEWLLSMIELQLEETPRWVTDKEALERISAWDRRVRTLATSVLHAKRLQRRRFVRWWDRAERLIWIIVAAGIGVAIGFFFGTLTK